MDSPFYIDPVKRQILLPTNMKESSPGKDNFQSRLWKYRCKPYNKKYHRFCIFQYIFRTWNFFLPSINCHWTDFHTMESPNKYFSNISDCNQLQLTLHEHAWFSQNSQPSGQSLLHGHAKMWDKPWTFFKYDYHYYNFQGLLHNLKNIHLHHNGQGNRYKCYRSGIGSFLVLQHV